MFGFTFQRGVSISHMAFLKCRALQYSISGRSTKYLFCGLLFFAVLLCCGWLYYFSEKIWRVRVTYFSGGAADKALRRQQLQSQQFATTIPQIQIHRYRYRYQALALALAMALATALVLPVVIVIVAVVVDIGILGKLGIFVVGIQSAACWN